MTKTPYFEPRSLAVAAAHFRLVRSMIRLTGAGFAVAVVFTLISCVTTADGIWVTRRVRDVSEEDIRLAITSSWHRYIRQAQPMQIDVVSRDEIHVYWTNFKGAGQGYSIAKRVHGKWTCEERVIVIS